MLREVCSLGDGMVRGHLGMGSIPRAGRGGGTTREAQMLLRNAYIFHEGSLFWNACRCFSIHTYARCVVVCVCGVHRTLKHGAALISAVLACDICASQFTIYIQISALGSGFHAVCAPIRCSYGRSVSCCMTRYFALESADSGALPGRSTTTV